MYNIAIPNMLNGVSQQPPQVRFPTQCEELINGYASPTESLTKRYPTEWVDFDWGTTEGQATDRNTKLHIIDRGDGKEAYAVAFSLPGIVRAYDLINDQPVDVQGVGQGGNYDYLDNVGDAQVDLSFATIADYTFICNRNVTVQMTNDTVAERNPESFVWVKTGNYGTTYTITLEALGDNGNSLGTLEVTQKTFTPGGTGANSDGYLNSDTTLDGETFPAGNSVIDTRLIAAQLAELLRTEFSGVFADFSVTRTDYGLHITLDDTTGTTKSFRASVADGLGGNGLRVVDRETQSFEDLPVIAPDGMITKIVGLPEVPEDDYYVRFSSNVQNSTGEGVWVETVAPGIQYRLDPATMPHALIRKFNPVSGDPFFVLTPIDGSDDANGVFWDDRTVGDDNSNPVPSFVGGEVSSIFTFQGRLGILSGESVSVSEAGNFFNFMRTTVTSVLDSDPIDVYSAYPKITKFRHAIPLGDRLILFSNKAQMLLTSPDTELLTPKTVVLEPAGQYEAFADCMPAQVDQEIYFPFKRGDNYTGVRDMVVNLQDASLIAAPEVTAHVPKYIYGEPKQMSASPFDRTLVLTTYESPNSLYVYKWFDRDNERIQSSWSKWVFKNEILSMGWYQSRLYLVMKDEEQERVFLRYIDLRENRTDFGTAFVSRLDDRQRLTPDANQQVVVSGSYTEGLSEPEPLLWKPSYFLGPDAPDVLLTSTPSEPVIVPPGGVTTFPGFTGPMDGTLQPPQPFDLEYWDDGPDGAQALRLGEQIFSAPVPFTAGVTATVSSKFEVWADSALSCADYSPPGTSGPDLTIRIGTYENSTSLIGLFNSFYLTTTVSFQGNATIYTIEPTGNVLTPASVAGFGFLLSGEIKVTKPTIASPGGYFVYKFESTLSLQCVESPPDGQLVDLGLGTRVNAFGPPWDNIDRPFTPAGSCTLSVLYSNQSSQVIQYGPTEGLGNAVYTPGVFIKADGPEAGTLVNVLDQFYTPPPVNDLGLGTTTFTLDYDGDVFYGNPYEFRYTFSQPYFRVGSQNAALGSGRFQVKNINVLYDDSGPFRAEVTPKNPLLSDSYVYDRGSTVNSSFVNAPIESGTMRIPVMGTTEQFNVSLVNDTPYPSKFTSAEIEASYSGRYRRI